MTSKFLKYTKQEERLFYRARYDVIMRHFTISPFHIKSNPESKDVEFQFEINEITHGSYFKYSSVREIVYQLRKGPWCSGYIVQGIQLAHKNAC